MRRRDVTGLPSGAALTLIVDDNERVVGAQLIDTDESFTLGEDDTGALQDGLDRYRHVGAVTTLGPTVNATEAVLDALADLRRERPIGLSSRDWGEIAERVSAVLERTVAAIGEGAVPAIYKTCGWNGCVSRLRTKIRGKLVCVSCGRHDTVDVRQRAAATRKRRRAEAEVDPDAPLIFDAADLAAADEVVW